MTKSQLITDNELRERGMSEIEIDRLNHKVETQLVSINGRDRAAVEAFIKQNQGPKLYGLSGLSG